MSRDRRSIDAPAAPAAIGPVNEVYARFFPADPPARAAVGVAALPKGAQVEVDAIVALGA